MSSDPSAAATAKYDGSRGDGGSGGDAADGSDEDEELYGSLTDKERGERILEQITSGNREMPAWYYENYEEDEIEEDLEDDDPTAIDPATLGKWDESDLLDPLEYEWDEEKQKNDPNDLSRSEFKHLNTDDRVDEDGVQFMWDPIRGDCDPFDERTIVNPSDSYVIDKKTRNDADVVPSFHPGDVEIEYNANITAFRKSLEIVETYVDPWLNMEVPRHTAKWYGYPESEYGADDHDDGENENENKNDNKRNNNDKGDGRRAGKTTKLAKKKKEKKYYDGGERFVDPKLATDFSGMTPYQARIKAVELARAKNNEWLPEGMSEAYHNKKTDIFVKMGLKVGSLERGDIDENIRAKIQTGVLDVLGMTAELIEIINGKVFRFHYRGLIKNKFGMAAWTESMIKDCGVEVTGVVFETGRRKRDPYYDGGDHWYGPY